MILHHYESSPYAEKIRLMFGYTGTSWSSLLSPPWPPRPNIDPLCGGYRRIPIGQMGADIFCDSTLIAREISTLTGHPELDPAEVTGPALVLMRNAEGDGFFSAISSIPGTTLLTTMLGNFGPLGTYRFVKDRSGLLKGGTAKPKAASDARAIMQALFRAADQLLSEQAWIGKDAPSAADFAVYHPLWLHLRCKGALPESAKNLLDWYKRITDLGHGHRRDIRQTDAFNAAREAAPRALPSHSTPGDLVIGQRITVQPEDYGVVAVEGRLAAINQERVVLARETRDFGLLHVHFPRGGYAVKAAASRS